MNTLERLKSYLELNGIPVGAAERACGFGNATLRNAFESGKGIGSDKVEKILSVYTDLSAEWLFRGVGNMTRVENNHEGNKYYEMCKMILENKKQENDLYARIANMIGE